MEIASRIIRRSHAPTHRCFLLTILSHPYLTHLEPTEEETPPRFTLMKNGWLRCIRGTGSPDRHADIGVRWSVTSLLCSLHSNRKGVEKNAAIIISPFVHLCAAAAPALSTAARSIAPPSPLPHPVCLPAQPPPGSTA